MYGMEIALKQTKIISMQSIFSLLFYIIYIHEIFKVNEPKRIPDIIKEILQWASGRLKLLLFVILFLLCLFLILICITYYFTENSKHFLGLCAIMAYEQYFLIRMYSSMNSISISCMHDYQYINIVCCLGKFLFLFSMKSRRWVTRKKLTRTISFLLVFASSISIYLLIFQWNP